MSKEAEYKEIFLAEAQENFEELNRLLTQLEKSPADKKSINAIFRITHTLKGNAAGMGFSKISDFAHVMEDLFGEAREGNIAFDESIFSMLFKSLDTLGALINSLNDGSTVRYRGIKTKMEVLLQSVQQNKEEATTTATAPPQEEKEINTTATEKEELAPKEKINEKKEPIEAEEDDTPESTKITFSDVVQVPVRKLDNLLNLVGELVIESDRIIESNSDLVDSNEYSRLNRISSDLQYSVMDVRLVQTGFLFNKFHRVVRDAANLEGKKVTLKLKGTETEIDRNILQIISDSLIHLIRNSVGHGIETPEDRKKNGKAEEGMVTLSAYSESDAVVIELSDDGAGINVDAVRAKAIKKGLISAEEAKQMADNDMVLMIFEPGFSTMDEVTSISGRGVGMDVVKKALDSVGGNIAVTTAMGEGTTFSLRLPASMAVKGTLLFELAKETFAIPLSYTEAVVSMYKPEIHKVANGLVSTYSGNTISIVFLKDLFNHQSRGQFNDKKVLHDSFDSLHPERKLEIVIVSYNNRTIGFVVDKLLQQKEIVEKPLKRPFDKVKLISGVTIMGNGHVCLVLNVAEICNLVFSRNFSSKNIVSI